MNSESLRRLKQLITGQRVLSLAVLVDGKPYLGLLPYAVKQDFTSLLIHASTLARHTRGLVPGAPYAALIHAPEDADSDPLQVARASFSGEVRPIEADAPDHLLLRDTYLRRLPSAEISFGLGDFKLYELRVREGRFVEGFASAGNVTPEDLRNMASGA